MWKHRYGLKKTLTVRAEGSQAQVRLLRLVSGQVNSALWLSSQFYCKASALSRPRTLTAEMALCQNWSLVDLVLRTT